MASKKKRQLQARKSRAWLYLGSVSALFVILIAFVWVNSANKVSSFPYGDNEQKQAEEFFLQIIAQVNPAVPENSYFPAALKRRLEWALTEWSHGRLEMTVATSIELPDGRIAPPRFGWMFSDYHNGLPRIGTQGPGLYRVIHENGGYITPLTPKMKNSMAASFAHESVHLDNKAYFQNKNVTIEQWLEEELRTWAIVTQDIYKPLREMGQPLDSNEVKADDAYRTCNYLLPCEQFRKVLSEIIGH